MGQIQLETKLRHLLDRYGADMAEYHVVYFLVESRKLLERDATLLKQFGLLRFYADWSLHAQNDRVTPAIKAVSARIYDMAARHIQAGHPPLSKTRNEMESFAHLDHLRAELTAFLAALGLPDRLVSDHAAWLRFSNSLIKVLEEQPIRKPTGDLNSIGFEPSGPDAVIFAVEFAKPVKGMPTYTYSNVLY